MSVVMDGFSDHTDLRSDLNLSSVSDTNSKVLLRSVPSEGRENRGFTNYTRSLRAASYIA